MASFALSNREEDALLKETKQEALKKCDDVVKGELLCQCILSQEQGLRLERPVRFRSMLFGTYRFRGMGLSGPAPQAPGLPETVYGARGNGGEEASVPQGASSDDMMYCTNTLMNRPIKVA